MQLTMLLKTFFFDWAVRQEKLQVEDKNSLSCRETRRVVLDNPFYWSTRDNPFCTCTIFENMKSNTSYTISPSSFSVYFIAGPLLVSAIFSFGLFLVDYRSDPKYLYHAQNSRAIIDQGIQDTHFPQNYSDFDPSRISLHGKYGRLIIQV